MRIEDIIGKVLDAVTGDDQPEEQQRRNVRPASQDPYGDPADQGYRQAGHHGGDVRPASEDPYGDPADGYQGQQVLPASQDPYGDPADAGHGQQVFSSSQDPYGDPADEEEREPARARRNPWPF